MNRDSIVISEGSHLHQMLANVLEVANRELLRSLGKDFIREETFGELQRFQRIAQGFAALVEGGLHHHLEHCFIAVEVFVGIPSQPDDRRLHLGRRIEGVFVHGKQVIDIEECLEQDTQYPIHFFPW